MKNKGEVMIFHESVYDGYHMMDWDLGHWIPMIFGWGIVLLAAIIILYMIIQSTRGTNEMNQTTIQEPKSKRNESKAYDNEEENIEKIIFCYSCGEKLDGRQIEYCPKCGTKI